jgi:hypothetical protein
VKVVTCGRLEGWSATKIPMMSPRGLARENARLERTKDFTDKLDWAMFKPETSNILTFKSDGNVKVKRALMFCYNLNVSPLTSNLKQKFSMI